MTSADDSDDDWDEFMDKFTKERYKGGFSEDNWEEVISKNIVYKTFILETSVTVDVVFGL